MAVTKIADIPFVERDTLEVLALDVDRVSPDADYAGFGWTRVDRVLLTAPQRPDVVVDDAIVVALHSADEQPEDGDLDLLFEIGDESLVVGLSRWLPHMLAQLPAQRPVVLALCNPRRVAIASEAAVLHYAYGDVTSWLDPDPGGPQLRLTARRWLVNTPAGSTATKEQP